MEKRARRWMGKARRRSKATGQTEHLDGETRDAAKSGKRTRRVLIKAAVVRHPGRDPQNNPRFVVTTLPDAPKTSYEQIDGQRGDVENRLKERHHGLAMDRTRCARFLANQFRVLLTLAAYIRFQALQRQARGSACADAQVTTLRERRLTLAGWVERSVRRIVRHLPTPFPGARRGRTARVRSAPPAEAAGNIRSRLDPETRLAVTSAFRVGACASGSASGHAGRIDVPTSSWRFEK